MNILLLSSQESELGPALADGKLTIIPADFPNALDMLQKHDFQLVLIDSDIRVKPGLRELKRIKSKRPEIPIIFITSTSSEEIILDAFRQGARDFFKKPINTYQLKKTISNLSRITKKPQEKRTPLVGKAQNIASPYAKATTDIPGNLLRTISHMEEHLTEDIDLEHLAKQAGMSKFHFCRTFKKYMDVSPMQFFTHMRMDHAKTLLGCSHRSVSEVAESVGFTDLSNFIKNFKKSIGSTPTGYRKTVRKKR